MSATRPTSLRGLTWRLAWAQITTHRAYAAWIVGLLSMLVGIVTYILIMGFTQANMQREADGLQGLGLDRAGWVSMPVGAGEDVASTPPHTMTEADLLAAVSARPEGDAIAIADSQLYTEPYTASTYDPYSESLRGEAVLGGSEDMTVISEGRAPSARGEVALAANLAASLQANRGDLVTFYLWHDNGTEVTFLPRDFTVVGIMPSSNLSGFQHSFPQARFDWSEASEPAGALTFTAPDVDGQLRSHASVTLRWDGADPLLDPYANYYAHSPLDFVSPSGSGGWYAAAVVLFMAMVVMSFAVGRSQAAARSQWVATTRTLGARRRQIVSATLAETMLLAVLASLCGVVVGWVGAQAHLWAARLHVPYPPGQSIVSWDWIILVAAFAVAILTGAIIAAVPAFWATRVAPVAALKPMSDLTEAEVSRRVTTLWLWIPLAIGLVLILVPVGSSGGFTGYKDVATVLGTLIVLLSGGALVIEGLRSAVPTIGRRLGRSSDPGILTAGDLLAGRPRQAVAPSLIVTAASAAITAWALYSSMAASYDAVMVWAMQDGEFNSLRSMLRSMGAGATWATLAVMGLALILVMAAVFVSQHLATSREIATREALGLSRRNTVKAHTLQQWIPQVVGASTGVVIGAIALLVVAAATEFSMGMGQPGSILVSGSMGASLLSLVFVLGIVAAFLVLSLAASWAVAWRASREPHASFFS